MTEEQQNPAPETPAQPTSPESAPAAAPAASAGVITKSDIEKNKVWAAVSYLGLLGIIVALVCEGKDSPFVKFHLNQSLCLLVASLVACVIVMVPLLGWVIAPLVWIVVFIFMIMGIINAAQGQVKRLPLVGNYDILK